MVNRWSLLLILALALLFVLPSQPAAAEETANSDTAAQMMKIVKDSAITGDGCSSPEGLIGLKDMAVPAAAHNSFTVIGDSWGFLFYGEFRDNMVDAGYGNMFEYYMRAIPGTEASQWVSNDQWCPLLFLLVKFLVRNDTGTPHVLISLGGNDLVNDYDVWGVSIYDRIEADLRMLVDDLIDENSDVVIIFSGYDIVNMYKNQYCTDWAIDLLGSAEPAVVNPGLIELGNRQAAVAADYPNVYYANVFGALQGTPGNPNINEYSPVHYFTDYPFWREDCIHMGLDGYDVFTQALVDWMENNGVIPLLASRSAAIEQ